MGRLTTHVLDTALGRPAGGLEIELYVLQPDQGDLRLLVKAVSTNEDGRVDQPLLEGEDMTVGSYELLFKAGDYLRRTGARLSNPPFLDDVPIRFQIADPTAHYHVPLLLSAFGYSTYRGS